MPENKMDSIRNKLKHHQSELKSCDACELMHGPAVHGGPIVSPILMIGQAPGPREIEINKPFAWTAGKTLFSWYESIGLAEEDFRKAVYMSAICRCFPGKVLGKTGDRVPNKIEIKRCGEWLGAEVNILKPQLIILVGKLAISQVLPVKKLTDVIGQQFHAQLHGHECDVIPLPHPSGLSTWYRTEPGKTLLLEALSLIQQHSAWQEIVTK